MDAPRMSQVIVAKAFTVLPADADKRAAVEALVQALVKARKLPADAVAGVIGEIMRRESVGSTGIGHGIGIPHCRIDTVKDIVCAYGHSAGGIDFDSLDGEPVHSVFLLLTPPDQKDRHLLLMRNFAGMIRKEHFSEFLHQVATPEALTDLLAEFETR
jgi:mannitol/fructose-specific phosphotransferase system IIA component (Ntr-type)